MKIALVEDELAELQALETMVMEILQETGIYDKEVRGFSGSREFLDAWEPGRFDVILLDIFLDEMDGVELARVIRERDPDVTLVFCTSSNEFAAQSYEVNARYYLLKPISRQSLNTMFQRIDLEKLEANRIIQLPDGFRFRLRKLMYTQYVNHVVTFYIKGMESHSIYTTQTEAEQILNQPFFFAANKGSIINLYMVRRVTPDSFIMKDGTTIPVARRRYKEAKEAYTRFHFEKLCGEVDF